MAKLRVNMDDLLSPRALSGETMNLLGHVRGLLEAWVDYGGANENLDKLTAAQVHRLDQLLRLLAWSEIVFLMQSGWPSEQRLIETVYKLVVFEPKSSPEGGDPSL